jgi:hypothetical protein
VIRFVDIRNQGTGRRFAFWDTISDQFLTFSGEQAWDTWEELEDSVTEQSGRLSFGGVLADRRTALLGRLRGLCPPWAFDGGEDDVEGWYRNT